MKTKLTRSIVKHAICKGPYRPAMAGVFYDAEEQQMAATDGHLLIIWPIDDTATDAPKESATFPVEAFPTKKPDAYTFEVEGTAITTHNCQSKTTTESLEDAYPNYKAVIPKERGGAFELGVDLALLKRLCDAIPGKEKRVIMTFESPNRAIQITPYGNSDAFKQALVMPFKREDK